MALADSGRAIGAVTKLLREHLTRRGFAVSVGRPEVAAATNTDAKLNLFLYETAFDASLRNVVPRPELPAPLWLTLRYLVTAFDASESSDSAEAHELLGRALSALHELNFLALDAAVPSDVRLALENCPEPLKLSFDETPADLLSKVMQGTDEKYRLSVAFQVRPVMIVPGDPPPSAALLVGVDSSVTPPRIIGRDGIGLAVLASMGPRLSRVEPAAFEPGDVVTVRGDDLHLDGLEAWLEGVPLSIVAQRPDRLSVRVEGAVSAPATEGPLAGGGALSAGERALVVRQRLPNGRARSSNLLAGRLRPVVSSATLAGGALTITGLLLGSWDDDVLVALHQDGRVARLFEPGPPPPAAPAPRTIVPGARQQALTIADAAGGVPAGEYQVIVRVNGQQARRAPTIEVGP